MKTKVVDISVRKRWEGMVVDLKTYDHYFNQGWNLDDDEREQLRFDTFETYGVTYNPSKHEIVEY